MKKANVAIGIAVGIFIFGFCASALAVPVTLRVVDQNGVEIQGSIINVDGIGSFTTGDSFDIPEGPRNFIIKPGMNGKPQVTGWDLQRSEIAEVTSSTNNINFEWRTSSVIFNLVDQNGTVIPYSKIFIEDALPDWQEMPVTATLPITDKSVYPTLAGYVSDGGYYIAIRPGMNGKPQVTGWTLQRNERQSISQTTTAASLEWITNSVTFDLVDQNGTPIAHSTIFIEDALPNWQEMPVTATLPITDESVYPTLAGYVKDGGYYVAIRPGMNGKPQVTGWTLQRNERTDVSQTTTTVPYRWITNSVTFDLLDQNGTRIPHSSIHIEDALPDWQEMPVTATLPITDKSVYPALSGYVSDGGYYIYIMPSINEIPQPLNGAVLIRDERSNIQRTTGNIKFEWISDTGIVQVVNSIGMAVNGSTFILDNNAYTTGSVMNLPITDNTVYPSAHGAYANGYSISVNPSDTMGSGIFNFKALSNKIFDPLFVTIDSRSYGLRFNKPPVANAGYDQTVRIADTVTLDAGASYDPEGNVPVAYEWSIITAPNGSTATLSNISIVNPTFIPDLSGNYEIQLIVTDSLGERSQSDALLVSTVNTAPVADAGSNQSVTSVGTTVHLDGSKSYDVDGDPITYQWAFVSTPQGSNAFFVNANSATPEFSVDVYGDYVVQLIVSDPYVQSSPSTTAIAFQNLPPVANAGISESVMLGYRVICDGRASSDPNGDTLAYYWSLASVPQGTNSVIIEPTASVTNFTPDLVGTYVVQLKVNDGLLDSPISTKQVEVITLETATIYTVQNVQTELQSPAIVTSLKNTTMQNALLNKLNAVIAGINSGNYTDALNQLKNDILKKTDGCATSGAPDNNDWITDCGSQAQIYPIILDAIAKLEALIG
ncbi:MAG: PKD domain-containing protein [Candidatus Omnitrophota bacterium]